MSDFSPAANRIEQAYQKYRLGIAVSGTVAVVTGLIILFWPSLALNVIAVIIGAYAVIAGAIYLGIGIFSKTLKSSSKIGRVILGVVLLALGILSLIYSGTTQTVLLWIIALAVGIAWIAEGALTMMVAIKSKNTSAWVLAYGIFAIVAGIAILMSPLYGDSFDVLRWLFGISFLVLGIAQIVRAVSVGKARTEIVEIIE